MFDAISPYLATLLPTVGVAFLFYWIIRYMIEADRRERKALASWRKEHERNDPNRGSVARGAEPEAGSAQDLQERPEDDGSISADGSASSGDNSTNASTDDPKA